MGTKISKEALMADAMKTIRTAEYQSRMELKNIERSIVNLTKQTKQLIVSNDIDGAKRTAGTLIRAMQNKARHHNMLGKCCDMMNEINNQKSNSLMQDSMLKITELSNAITQGIPISNLHSMSLDYASSQDVMRDRNEMVENSLTINDGDMNADMTALFNKLVDEVRVEQDILMPAAPYRNLTLDIDIDNRFNALLGNDKTTAAASSSKV